MKLSLGNKIVLLVVTFALALVGIGIGVSYRVVDDMNDRNFMAKANELGATVARVIDVDRAQRLKEQALDIYARLEEHVKSDAMGTPAFDEYVANFASLEQTPDYQALLAQLRSIQEVNEVDCLYLSLVDPHDVVCMYLVDAALEEPCPIGCLDELYEVNYAVLTDPHVGFPAYVTNTPEYGWLVSAGSPVVDEQGNVVCYAFVDISMDAVKQQQRTYVMGLAGGLLGLTLLLSIVTIIYVRHSIVRPLNELSEAAVRYCSPSEGYHRSSFKELDIHTKDEIEDLHRSMVQMESDIDGYVDNLVETKAKLNDTRLEAALMSDLAHRDALTGIRNKLAYDQEVVRIDDALSLGQTEFGIALIDLNDLKVINDRYGHERGDISIKALTKTICDVYAHSPVFRIGGDEFAVLLREGDYRRAEELAQEFRARIEALRTPREGAEPWDLISAALGYALFDPDRDTRALDVFRRADEQMYENKRRMKNGAVPR